MDTKIFELKNAKIAKTTIQGQTWTVCPEYQILKVIKEPQVWNNRYTSKVFRSGRLLEAWESSMTMKISE